MVKRSLTLLEVMIAMSLMAIILFFVLSPFKETAILSNRAAKATEKVLRYQTVHARLSRLFAQQEDAFSYIENALSFTTQIGIDPNPALSSSVEAAVYLDKQKNLLLELWPKETPRENNPDTRIEVLLSDVSSLDWTFFQLEEGKVHRQKEWKETSPPAWITLCIDGYELPFTLAKTTGGIAL